MVRRGPVLTLARQLPARFDVSAATVLPTPARRGRIATQVRQDLWRALRGQRGFSPVVEVTDQACDGGVGLRVRAGGRVMAARFDRTLLEAKIAALLADPGNRARWLGAARGGRR